MQRLVSPSLIAAAFLAFSLYTPAKVSFTDYLIPLAVFFYLFARAVSFRTEQYMVLVGYVLWAVTYSAMIYVGISRQRSLWPTMGGVTWLVNEFLVSCTKVYEPNQDTSQQLKPYVTPRYVRVGYAVFLTLDIILNAISVYYGSGEPYDEFGWFPTATLADRTQTFVTWVGICTLANVVFVRIFHPRQVKYFGYAFIYVCHAATLRLPIFSDFEQDAVLSTIIKLQIFASAGYIVRFTSTTLPSPKLLFRALMIGMPLFSAWATTSRLNQVVTMSTEEFTSASFTWFALFWVVLAVSTALTPGTANSQVHPIQPSRSHQIHAE